MKDFGDNLEENNGVPSNLNKLSLSLAKADPSPGIAEYQGQLDIFALSPCIMEDKPQYRNIENKINVKMHF